MPTPTRKGILLVLLAIFSVVAVAVIPGIISEEMRAWCLSMFGEGYQGYLLGFFIIGSVILLFLTTDIGNWLRPRATPSKPDRFNIPPGAATRRQINLAREAIKDAEPEKALQHLSDLKVPALDTEIATLSSRYAEYRRSSRQGIDSRDEENRTYNRITKDILDLIKTLESELATGAENYQTIKEYLKKRYTNRLGQKLANRQPVNLRRIPSTEGTSDDHAAASITYSSDEVAGTMAQNFRDARGRLLLIGAPGAGKTTLMLQLVLDLLDSEPDALPVLLNLATWSSEYITLNAWLEKILPAELGVSDKYAAEIMQQGRLILLLDGFDEIRQDDRAACLDAIGRCGEDASRQFVISSRIAEYQAVAGDAPVYWQIEVGPLSIDQLEAELNRLWEQENQPEARALLQAIQKDSLLRESVETPFYFNTLQILFGGGKTLADLRCSGETLEARQAEILERFIEYELKAPARQEYPPEKIKHWLSFLASRMTDRNMVVFELRDLQYDWTGWSKLQLRLGWLVYGLAYGLGLVGGLVSGLVGSLIFGLAGGVVVGLVGWLVGGLVYGLVYLMDGGLPIITTKDSINWSLSNFKKYLRKDMVVIGLVSGLVSGLIGVLVFGMVYGMVFGLIYPMGIVIGTGLTGGLVGGLISGLVGILEDSTDILQITSPYHRFTASMKALHFSILQHGLLRYQFYKKSLLPLHLVHFLNDQSRRHILEFDSDPHTGKGGGSWRFRHRILQEWFAKEWVERNT